MWHNNNIFLWQQCISVYEAHIFKQQSADSDKTHEKCQQTIIEDCKTTQFDVGMDNSECQPEHEKQRVVKDRTRKSEKEKLTFAPG